MTKTITMIETKAAPAVTAASTSLYTVVKNLNRWAIQRDGVNVDCWSWRKTRKECVEQIPKLIATDEYRAKVMEQDRSGVYTWDADEERQIADYAEKLKAWTMNGKTTLQAKARLQQQADRDVVNGPREHWLDADRLFAEKRRINGGVGGSVQAGRAGAGRSGDHQRRGALCRLMPMTFTAI
jgi:hypothetical protein